LVGENDDAVLLFNKMLEFTNCSAALLLECFNHLVENKLYTLALQMGTHLLQACEKFAVDTEM
jgi:hypothetical protein